MSTVPGQEQSPPRTAETQDRAGPARGVDHLFYDDLVAFYRELEETLLALQADFLSEATRKEQRLLLAISFLLLLVARGTIEVNPKQTVDLSVVQLAIDFGGTLVLLGAAVCLFFVITYAIRAYADWISFSIRRARAEAQFEMISLKLEETWDGIKPRPFEETEKAIRFQIERGYDDTHVDWAQYNKERSEYNRKVWGLATKREWASRHIGRIRQARWLRFAFELFFPLLFGLVALFEAYRRIAP